MGGCADLPLSVILGHAKGIKDDCARCTKAIGKGCVVVGWVGLAGYADDFGRR